MSDEPKAEALARAYTLLSAGFQLIAHAADVLDLAGESELREAIIEIEAPSYVLMQRVVEARRAAR